MIIFTVLPKRGDICLGDRQTKELLYVKLENIAALSEIDQTVYEIEGIVVGRRGNDVILVHPSRRQSMKWSDRYSFKLTGYTLDGTERTGVLSICDSSAWGTYKDYTFTYKATTLAQLVEQLNTAFAADTIAYDGAQVANVFKTQDWCAQTGWNGDDDDALTLHFAYSDYRQASNKGKSGFTLTANLLTDVLARASMLRRSGNAGGEGAISSWYRALTYFRTDNDSENYNPNTVQTSIKRTYPICLPGYLGKSEKRKDASGNYVDYCAQLRAVYGDGEEGWLRFMETCRPVLYTDYGNMGMTDGLARTKLLAGKRYSSLTKTGLPLCPAANYCYDTATECLPQGSWFMGTTRDIARLLDGVMYPSHTSNRKSDALNKALLFIGGSAVSNGSGIWSCLRGGSYHAWCALGSGGFFGNYYMCYSYAAIPLSLVKLAKPALKS